MAIAWTIAVTRLYGRRRVWLLPVGLAIAVVLLVAEAKAGFLFAALGTIGVGLTRAIANPKRGLLEVVQYGLISVAAIATLFAGYMYLGSYLPIGQSLSKYWVAWLQNPSAIVAYLLLWARRPSGPSRGR